MQQIYPNVEYFESQEEGDKVILLARKHWLVMITPVVASIFITIIISAGYFWMTTYAPVLKDSALAKAFSTVLVSLFILFSTLFAYALWLIRYLNCVILTQRHLVEIQQNSLFFRKISQLDLENVEDATASERGIVETGLHFGTVIIQTAGELENFKFEQMPEPYELAQKIMEIKEQCENERRNGMASGAANIIATQMAAQSAAPVVSPATQTENTSPDQSGPQDLEIN
jgi:hypothetical protein